MKALDLNPTELRRRPEVTVSLAPQARWRAAVLVPFVHAADGWHLLFIRRAEHPQDEHSGQVAFPGGRLAPGDAGAVACALRETEEEIGLAPSLVEVVGELAVQRTRTGYPVQPVAGIAPWPVPLRPDPAEVARCFTIPLQWLADPANRRPVRYLMPDGRPAQVAGFRRFAGEHLWGLSARIVLDVLARMGPGIAAPEDLAPLRRSRS